MFSETPVQPTSVAGSMGKRLVRRAALDSSYLPTPHRVTQAGRYQSGDRPRSVSFLPKFYRSGN
jgi:hypothetical protein